MRETVAHPMGRPWARGDKSETSIFRAPGVGIDKYGAGVNQFFLIAVPIPRANPRCGLKIIPNDDGKCLLRSDLPRW